MRARPQGPAPLPTAVTGLGLARPSHVELGRALLALLKGDGPDPVFCEGVLRRYDPATGLWNAVPLPLQERLLHGFDGHLLPGWSQPLTLTQNLLRGATTCAAAQVFDDAFLDHAEPGVGFANGFLRVSPEGAELVPHDPGRRATFGLPVPYSPGLAAPRWAAFLDSLFEGAGDRLEKQALLQEYLGVSLLGLATRFSTVLLLLGDGDNGKSVVLRVASGLFPKEAVATLSPHLWVDESRLVELAGVRLNCVAELKQAQLQSSDVFKIVVAGDALSIRASRGHAFRMRPIAGHLFAANGIPEITDPSHGFWRRLSPIRFDRTFAARDQDPFLPDRILAAERAAITAWAIDGAVRAIKRGHLTLPASTAPTQKEWRQATDHTPQFLREAVVADADARMPYDDLFQRYRRWARAAGHLPFTPRAFALRLQAQGHRPLHTRSGSVYALAWSESASPTPTANDKEPNP
jgi:P4 family phage/plasmid primase-like protien